MVNLPTKFEVSTFSSYGDIQEAQLSLGDRASALSVEIW